MGGVITTKVITDLEIKKTNRVKMWDVSKYAVTKIGVSTVNDGVAVADDGNALTLEELKNLVVRKIIDNTSIDAVYIYTTKAGYNNVYIFSGGSVGYKYFGEIADSIRKCNGYDWEE